jgi:hypothetical protein
MSGYFIGTSIVINDDAAYVHESFSTVGVGTTENMKITASDGASGDLFGQSVAVGSGRIVVGADRDDDNGTDSGSAYIYDLDGNQLAKITASDGAADDYFGDSVAVGSGRIVVGAYRDDDNGSRSGSAYIYDLDGNQLSKITASDGAADDYFGFSVAVGSGRIVVGAYQDDDNGFNSGSAYIFDLDGNQLAKITASDGASADNFGDSVAVGSGRIVVGADGDGFLSGSAYIFDLDGNQLSKITASDGASSDWFGRSVAVGSGRIVVGAYQDDDNGSLSGSAYIYDLDGNQLAKITASDGAASDYFGFSVAVGSGRIVVGAYLDDDNGTDSGSAYIFDLDGNQLAKITASDGASFDRFGWSVAVGSGRIVVGATLDDDNGSNSGSAYIFNLPEDSNTYWERVLETYKY